MLEGQRRIFVTSGAAQGSILGPDLWIVQSVEDRDACGTRLVGYAGDVVALIGYLPQGKSKWYNSRHGYEKINGRKRDHGLPLTHS